MNEDKYTQEDIPKIIAKLKFENEEEFKKQLYQWIAVEEKVSQ